MPKRTVSETDDTGYFVPGILPMWRAAGLSLAVAGSAVFNGVGALGAVLIAAVVVYALERLHRHAPEAPSTGDLVGSTLGPSVARFTGMIQLAAYVVMAAGVAVSLGGLSFYHSADPASAMASWWWPMLSLAFVGLAATLVAVLPTRTIGAAAAVLAVVGLLVYFYVGLAIIAKMLSGTAPLDIGPQRFPSALITLATVIPLGLGLAGFEVASAANGRLRSVGRPLGVVLAGVAVCTLTLLVAVNLATTSGFQYQAGSFSAIAIEIFGESSRFWLLAGPVPLSCAALLALLWAATRVAGRLFGGGVATSSLVAAATAVVAVALCRYQRDISGLLSIVAALLLLAVYVLVAEANSRVSGTVAAMQAPRAVVLATAAAVVFIPLRARDFAIAAWWPLGVTVLIVGVAALLSGVGRTERPAPQPR
ncbi:APC family permease [Mycolicibacterium brisbanense]|uniref:Amino acid transporter n=1 Tax=Mycolicibacterium brisbanense TaxID=146020 RepID=A0A117I7W2_9MYCO|nr:APC family permease [Mycolicibacterium brisbanense]MCV7159525.1 APC family permease [Mycolicibacterium brisbanense]GAS92313.1 uncharacterized protein RMCB_6409 [Mycolicibacterium brisbanense]